MVGGLAGGFGKFSPPCSNQLNDTEQRVTACSRAV